MKTLYLRNRASKAREPGEAEPDGDSSRHWRTCAEFSADALQRNYEIIHSSMPKQAILPMVKANGYGSGIEWVARMLFGFPSLYGFGVATLEEGAFLREALGPRGRRTQIVVFSGTAPWSEEKGHFCERYHLVPAIASDSDWDMFFKQGWPERIPYELKFNTGMNRLGLSFQAVSQVAKKLRVKPVSWHPQGVFSHLAIAETPDARLSQQQLERFIALRSQLKSAVSSAVFHLGNSAAIWNHKHWKLDELTDVIRPGISIYGIPPWAGAPARGLRPVLTLRATVVAVHLLKPGESIGYGATYRVSAHSAKPERVAILAAGYGDGIHRAMSNQGHVFLNGRLEKMLGVLSMDLLAVRCGPDTQVGDQAELLGPRVDPWSQAKAAGTIPYELLTSITGRVQRRYV